jgi:anaerobic selenocysteine-containing dehydrogenase
MSYAKLTGGSGIQWPCNETFPNGARHLYTDGRFNTEAEQCETYGHDLDTGSAMTAEHYGAQNPQGRALIKASDYIAPYEQPDKDYPLWLTTGRLVYHFHTRTKTGRVKELQDTAPDAFVEISKEDAAAYNIREGDMVEVRSRRGYVLVPAHLTDIRLGVLFIPFHYGYWDDNTRPRAANELTLEEWDPVSKQPHYKLSAVRIRKVSDSRREA